MTTILKPGIEKIMGYFYNNKWQTIHLRELSRRIKLEGQSITRYLYLLEKKNILYSKKEGNQKRYGIKSTKRIFAIFSFFDINKFEKLPEIKKQAINTYLINLPEQPIYTILFGSTAKENYTQDSDLDILIITNNKIDPKKAEKEVDALKEKKISSFQIVYKDYKKELK